MNTKTFIILLLFIVGFVAIILISSKTYKLDSSYRQTKETTNDPFSGRTCSTLECIADKFLDCNMAKYGNNGTIILIYGLVNDKCHVNVSKNTTKDCYLSQNNLSIPLLNQLLGNDEGLGNIVQQECE